jgi:hypothetical protein
METQATVIHPRRGSMRAVGDALGTLAVSAADVVGEVIRTAAPAARDVRKRTIHRHPCQHDECNCHCTCCVCDADLVVYTRLGERRVVPIEIENTRSRDREVKLSVSDFTTRGGRPAPVKVALAGDTDFTIGPCSRQDATLLVDVAGEDQADKREKDRHKLPDVDDCVVAVGDLRVDGCDIRPARIAVAIVPRDCSPYEIECGCCC